MTRALPTELTEELKRGLRTIYAERLKDVILYGSSARGEATEHSDIDLAIVLSGPVQPGQEIERMLEFITDLNLTYGILISIYPVSEEAFDSVRSPLLLNIQREGVTL